MPRPYRIEMGSQNHPDGSDQTPDSGADGRIPRFRLDAPRAEPQANPEGEMWGMLGEIQSRLDTVKTEITALRHGGASSRVDTGAVAPPATNQSRNADELYAVIGATETATNTILAAAEDVGEVAEILAADGDAAMEEHAEALLNAMVTIYQACNFQDIAGQRLARVIASLSLIDKNVTELVETWRSGGTETPTDLNGDPDELLHGPASEDDKNVVSQNDIDALFG